jgi:starch-binding outer membrane protein, SusD/RagB family
MKSIIIKLLFIVPVILISVSCQDTLEPKIYSFYTENNFPKTNDDVNFVLSSFYANFSSEWGPQDPNILATAKTNAEKKAAVMWSVYSCTNGWYHLSTSCTDEMVDNWNPIFGAFSYNDGLGSFINGNNGPVLWNGLYQRVTVVAKATAFIKQFDDQINAIKAKGALTSKDTADIKLRVRAKAELKCMRAWTMFLLYDWFGAVDVRLDPDHLMDTELAMRPPADPTSEYTKNYLRHMVSDFKAGIQDMYSYSEAKATNYGRLHKDVARMLLMKHYMNYASQTNTNSYWDSAKVYCDQIISSGSYSLEPVYSDVFSKITNTDAGTKEVIWATTYGPTRQSWHFHTNLPKGCNNICGIDVDTTNAWDGFQIPWSFYYKYSAGDKRLKTIGSEFYKVNAKTGKNELIKIGNAAALQTNLPKGAYAVKWLISFDRSSTGQYGFAAFRFADVLLSAAEIENNLNGPTQKAKDYLKLVTDRSGTSAAVDFMNDETGNQVTGAATALATGDKQVFSDFLLDERGRELYWEGWRRMDLIRFKNAAGQSKYIEYAKTQNKDATDKYLYFPLPFKAMTEGRGIYQNNPGY